MSPGCVEELAGHLNGSFFGSAEPLVNGIAKLYELEGSAGFTESEYHGMFVEGLVQHANAGLEDRSGPLNDRLDVMRPVVERTADGIQSLSAISNIGRDKLARTLWISLIERMEYGLQFNGDHASRL